MASQHAFGLKHAASAEVQDGLGAVADPLPPDADAGAVAALAFAPPLPMNADRVRNVVGQLHGAGPRASAVHPLGGEADHDAERSHKLGAEGVKDHDDVFKASEQVEGEKSAEAAKKAETAEGSVADHFELEASEGAASVLGAGLGASGVHPLGGGEGHDTDRSHDPELGIDDVFKAAGNKIAEGANVVGKSGREAAEGAASIPGAGLSASGVHPLGGGEGHDADRSHDPELGIDDVFKAAGNKTAEGANVVGKFGREAAEGAASVPGASGAHSLGGGSGQDAEHGIGGPTGETDLAKLSDKTGADYSNSESENQCEDGDDAEREQDSGCARAAARWAIGGLVGIGAALVAYAAVRALPALPWRCPPAGAAGQPHCR